MRIFINLYIIIFLRKDRSFTNLGKKKSQSVQYNQKEGYFPSLELHFNNIGVYKVIYFNYIKIFSCSSSFDMPCFYRFVIALV